MTHFTVEKVSALSGLLQIAHYELMPIGLLQSPAMEVMVAHLVLLCIHVYIEGHYVDN